MPPQSSTPETGFPIAIAGMIFMKITRQSFIIYGEQVMDRIFPGLLCKQYFPENAAALGVSNFHEMSHSFLLLHVAAYCATNRAKECCAQLSHGGWIRRFCLPGNRQQQPPPRHGQPRACAVLSAWEAHPAGTPMTRMPNREKSRRDEASMKNIAVPNGLLGKTAQQRTMRVSQRQRARLVIPRYLSAAQNRRQEAWPSARTANGNMLIAAAAETPQYAGSWPRIPLAAALPAA